MNKRLEKMVKKIEERRADKNARGDRKIVTPRRDQVKKAVEENAFDFMIYKGYDEIYDVEPVKCKATLENFSNYWFTSGDMWASIKEEGGKEYLVVTIKYGYSYKDLYAEINKETKKENVKLDNFKNNSEIIINLNEEKQGIEISFATKPEKEVLDSLKAQGFRWHRVKKVWYAKQTEERMQFVNSLVPTQKEEIKEVKEIENNETKKPFTPEEMKKANDIIENLIDIGYELLSVEINPENNYIYGTFKDECGSLSKDIIFIPANDLHDLEGVYNCLKGRILPSISIDGMEELTEFNTLIEESKEELKEIKPTAETIEIIDISSKNIFIKALSPELNKNSNKAENDEEINTKSYLQKYKITEVIKMTKEQYNYFSNHLLRDYNFLQGKGGYKLDENENLLHYYAIAVICENKEILIVDPSGSTYARYLNKLVEGEELIINSISSTEEINIKVDNKKYNNSYDLINDNDIYIINSSYDEILKDDRIILSQYLNDLKLVTGLTLKEFIEENRTIDIINIKKCNYSIETLEEALYKTDNGLVFSLIPTENEKKLAKISMLERLYKELERVKKTA